MLCYAPFSPSRASLHIEQGLYTSTNACVRMAFPSLHHPHKWRLLLFLHRNAQGGQVLDAGQGELLQMLGQVLAQDSFGFGKTKERKQVHILHMARQRSKQRWPKQALGLLPDKGVAAAAGKIPQLAHGSNLWGLIAHLHKAAPGLGMSLLRFLVRSTEHSGAEHHTDSITQPRLLIRNEQPAVAKFHMAH